MDNNLNVYELIGGIKSNDYINIKHNINDKCIQTNGVVKKIDKLKGGDTISISGSAYVYTAVTGSCAKE